MTAPFVQFVGPNHNLQMGGVKLLGVNSDNARKLLFTVIFLGVLYLLGLILRFIASRAGSHRQRAAFWSAQAVRLILLIIGVLGFLSIWFDNPTRLATGAGLIGAGIAFAMQKVVTSFAGYFVILRGKTFNVGDRIKMGDVRGDVIALNFIQTVIMEMGEPPAVQQEDPSMWVRSRQYSGRIVTISNAEIFEKPVYNYTRDFPYLWEEMHLPIAYKDDYRRAEQIMFEAVSAHTTEIANLAQTELDRLKLSSSLNLPTFALASSTASPTTGSSSPSAFFAARTTSADSRTRSAAKCSPPSNRPVSESPPAPTTSSDSRPSASKIPSRVPPPTKTRILVRRDNQPRSARHLIYSCKKSNIRRNR